MVHKKNTSSNRKLVEFFIVLSLSILTEFLDFPAREGLIVGLLVYVFWRVDVVKISGLSSDLLIRLGLTIIAIAEGLLLWEVRNVLSGSFSTSESIEQAIFLRNEFFLFVLVIVVPFSSFLLSPRLKVQGDLQKVALKFATEQEIRLMKSEKRLTYELSWILFAISFVEAIFISIALNFSLVASLAATVVSLIRIEDRRLKKLRELDALLITQISFLHGKSFKKSQFGQLLLASWLPFLAFSLLANSREVPELAFLLAPILLYNAFSLERLEKASKHQPTDLLIFDIVPLLVCLVLLNGSFYSYSQALITIPPYVLQGPGYEMRIGGDAWVGVWRSLLSTASIVSAIMLVLEFTPKARKYRSKMVNLEMERAILIFGCSVSMFAYTGSGGVLALVALCVALYLYFFSFDKWVAVGEPHPGGLTS